MNAGAPGPRQWSALRLALPSLFLAAAAVYCYLLDDPYVALLALPFFILGCARGKHPVVLSALALLPAAVLLAVSFAKSEATGVPLVAYDHFFVRGNLVMLAYNDWRVALGIGLAAVAAYYYVRALVSARRGAWTGFEKGALVGLAVVSGVCLYAMRSESQIAIWEPRSHYPTIRTLVKSMAAPSPQLQLVGSAAAAVPSKGPEGTRTGISAPPERPDILFILQESTFLPEVLRPGHRPRHLFAGPAAQRGPLRVHTYGGGTWRTEFSLTTQMRAQEFGGDGLYVFHQLEGRVHRSIFTELKKLGYRTAVFYPVPGFFINAAPFYASIGVDEFYDPQSLGISQGWDWKTPDEKFYGAMLKKLEGSAQPVVALMLTISQHGPHATQDPLSDYVARFDEADRAYGAFLEALTARGRKTGLVTFGDHQPEFTLRYIRDVKARHMTTYDIRCINFACADSAASRAQALDVVMLAPAALERFGFGLDALSIAQRAAFAECLDDTNRCAEQRRLEFNTAFAPYFQ